MNCSSRFSGRLALAFWLIGASNSAAAPLIIELEVSSQRIRARDPLYVKVTITNSMTEPWKSERSIDAGSGLIGFQRRYKGHRWHRVRAQNEGLICSFPRQPIKVEAGEKYVAYELLFRDKMLNEDFVFAYGNESMQLRARVSYDRKFIWSEPVNIVVVPAPSAEEPLAEKVLPFRWLTIVGRLEATDDKNDQQKLIEELWQTRKELDPVTREVVTVRLARFFFLQKEWDRLRAELARLPHRTTDRDSLLQQLQTATAKDRHPVSPSSRSKK